jgi:hypothetical protein
MQIANVSTETTKAATTCRSRSIRHPHGNIAASESSCHSQSNDGKIASMSAVEAIEQAIERLTAAEREALESRLLNRRFGLDTLNELERTELLASLDQAERDIDEGRSHTAGELRQAVRSWTGK